MDSPAYLRFADELRATGIISDPWFEGAARFAEEPIVLPAAELARLYRAAEDVARVYNELCRFCADEPALLDDFFGLTPYQKLMWLSSAPSWHGIARADVFATDKGLAVCELNCDTPSGEAEAVVLNELALRRHPSRLDPNDRLGHRFCALATAVAERSGPLSVGILYPTEITEDLSMVGLYQRWFEALGWRVTLGSPFNLEPGPDHTAYLFGTRCDVVIRHYKTDWWGEREAVWADAAPFADAEPLARPLGVLLNAVLHGRTEIINPFGAVLPQNKKSLAFFWERFAAFAPWAQEIIRHHIPYTVRLTTLDRAQLRRERARWVLKSDYGCEGDEVILGADCSADEWDSVLEQAIPNRWVAQRRFDARVDDAGHSRNYGIYLIAGQASGILTRSQRGKTDVRAVAAPTLTEAT